MPASSGGDGHADAPALRNGLAPECCASLRERVVRELVEQPLATGDAAIEVASAHLFEQARRDGFNRLATRDALMVDAEPERPGVVLVNRYYAIKRAGLM